jgi:protein-tyrosine phosphatase
MAGVSRSVTLVLAFLIKKKGMTYDEAYSMVKQRRRIVSVILFRYTRMMGLLDNYETMNFNVKKEMLQHQK